MSWFESLSLVDLWPLLFTVVAVVGYEAFLRYRTKLDPDYTIQGQSNRARRAWIFALGKRNDREILAVQTLRNSTMAATFLASTAVLLIMGALTFSAQADHSAAASLFAQNGRGLLRLKVILLVSIFFVGFFSFTSAIRYYNHLIYIVGTLNEEEPATLEYAAAMLNRAGRFYRFGMRSYYYAVPIVLWLFGDLLLLLGTVGLLIALHRLDRSPKLEKIDSGSIQT